MSQRSFNSRDVMPASEYERSPKAIGAPLGACNIALPFGQQDWRSKIEIRLAMKVFRNAIFPAGTPMYPSQAAGSVLRSCLRHIESSFRRVPFRGVDALRQRLGAKWNVFCTSVRSDHMNLNLGSTCREINVVADFGAELHLTVIFQSRTLR